MEGFLRDPSVVVEQIRQRLAAERSNSQASQEHLGRLENGLAAKLTERDRIILRCSAKGLINESDLERQLNQIGREDGGLRANIEDLSARLLGVADGAAQLQSAQVLLDRLRSGLDEGACWGVRRQLMEALIGGIRINTSEEEGKRRALVEVTYRFASVTAVCTDTRADSNWSLV